jgi:NADPH2:quinone reductase
MIEDVDELRPGPGQILVEVRAAGVNPVDTYIRSGTHAIKPPLPYTPGLDAAGLIVGVGDDVRGWERGDRVYVAGSASGTYAEQVLCSDDQVHRLPATVTFQQGAAVGVPYATAYRALFGAARARAGETVLVQGASGGVGIAAVQLARAAGLTVIGTAGTDRGRSLVADQGAHHVVDHNAPDPAAAITSLTGGRGVDIVLEMLANRNLARDVQLVAPRGRVVVVGSRGPTEINPRDVMVREATIHGVFLLGIGPDEMRRTHAALGAALESGVARPVIGRELPLADARRAHEAVLEPGSYGKTVLIP